MPYTTNDNDNLIKVTENQDPQDSPDSKDGFGIRIPIPDFSFISEIGKFIKNVPVLIRSVYRHIKRETDCDNNLGNSSHNRNLVVHEGRIYHIARTAHIKSSTQGQDIGTSGFVFRGFSGVSGVRGYSGVTGIQGVTGITRQDSQGSTGIDQGVTGLQPERLEPKPDYSNIKLKSRYDLLLLNTIDSELADDSENPIEEIPENELSKIMGYSQKDRDLIDKTFGKI